MCGWKGTCRSSTQRQAMLIMMGVTRCTPLRRRGGTKVQLVGPQITRCSPFDKRVDVGRVYQQVFGGLEDYDRDPHLQEENEEIRREQRVRE